MNRSVNMPAQCNGFLKVLCDIAPLYYGQYWIWTLSFHHYTCPHHVWDKIKRDLNCVKICMNELTKKCYGIKTKLYCKSILIISGQIFVRWMKAIFGFKKWIGFIPIDENNNRMMMIDTQILHKQLLNVNLDGRQN